MQTIENIAEELAWKGERAKQIGRLEDNDELDNFLLNQILDGEWTIHQYINR